MPKLGGWFQAVCEYTRPKCEIISVLSNVLRRIGGNPAEIDDMDHSGFRKALSSLVPIAKGALRIGTGEGIRHAGRFLSGALPDWSSFAQWIDWQDDFARQHHLPEASSTLARKPVDAYFGYGLAKKERIALLKEHYQLAAAVLTPTDLRALWSGGSVDMGQISGRKRGYRLRITRSDMAATRQEGEFTFLLECGETGLVSVVE